MIGGDVRGALNNSPIIALAENWAGKAAMSPLRRGAIKLEVCAGHLNSMAGKIENGHANADEFEAAIMNYDFSRDEFRKEILRVSGESADSLLRWLTL